MQSVHSLSRLSKLSVLFSWQIVINILVSDSIELLVIGILVLELESKMSKLSQLISIVIRL